MKLRDLTILQYQNVTKSAHLHRLWLSLEAFKKQMTYLAENNFHVLSLDEAIGYMERKVEVNGKRPISMTFDNGFISFYAEVLPVLKTYGFPAAVLVSPEKLDSTATIGAHPVPYLTWELLKGLDEQNITLGTYEDAALNINQIPEALVRDHITTFKKQMEDRLGRRIDYHGVKEGVPKSEIRSLLIAEGYRAFMTQCPTKQKPDLYAVGRIQVDDEDFNIFLSKISTTYLFFKDKESWKYIRKYRLDRVAHRMSETYNWIRSLEV
ncbi:MAG: hypothetical protein C4530_07985 [Desulfobacteraceae bacterium]|nr:MAG: hypothetical protein C4530_07985 [Desulfobacteraceae bacterium]